MVCKCKPRDVLGLGTVEKRALRAEVGQILKKFIRSISNCLNTAPSGDSRQLSE